MKLSGKLLIGGTAIFVILVGAAIYISQQAEAFKKQHQAFAQAFITDLAQNWDVNAVSTRMSDSFIEQAQSDNGQAYLRAFAALGRLISIDEIETGQYFSDAEGTRGELVMRINFQTGLTSVKLTLHEQDAKVRVQGITINQLDAEGRRSEIQPLNTSAG